MDFYAFDIHNYDQYIDVDQLFSPYWVHGNKKYVGEIRSSNILLGKLREIVEEKEIECFVVYDLEIMEGYCIALTNVKMAFHSCEALLYFKMAVM